jgi:hypothetical protein
MWNSKMDGRSSALACILVVLVLFGSTMSAGFFSILFFEVDFVAYTYFKGNLEIYQNNSR